MDEASIRQVLKEFKLYDASLCTKNGGWITHACPFAPYKHKGGRDYNPSFGISIDDSGISAYNCFTCKSKGIFFRLKDAVERASGNTEGDLRSIIYALDIENNSLSTCTPCKPIKVDYSEKNKPEPLNKNVYEGIYRKIEHYPEAISYLEDRKISLETANKLGLLYDHKDLRIIFPVLDKNKDLYGFAGRTILHNWKEVGTVKKKYPRIKNYGGLKKDWFLLGEHLVEPNKPFLVVEGLFGYAHLHEIGASNTFNIVAIMGSNLSKAQARALIRFNMPVYLLLDNDEAGDVGIFGAKGKEENSAVSQLYGNAPLYIPEWPEGKVDPDELVKEDIEYLYNTDYFLYKN